MEFEWDPAKSAATEALRGFDFLFAIRIFDRPLIEELDERKAYGELRMKAIGAVGEVVLVLIYTDRLDARRVISARPANRKERAQWLNSFV